MKIRKAKLTDINKVISIGKNVNEFKVAKDTINFWPKNVLIKLVKSQKDLMLVAEEAGKIIGFVIVNYNNNLSKAIIENIYVLSEFRNSGVGKKLLDSTLTILKKRKCSYVLALVENKYIKTIKWYSKQGFTKGVQCTWLDKKQGKTFIRK